MAVFRWLRHRLLAKIDLSVPLVGIFQSYAVGQPRDLGRTNSWLIHGAGGLAF